MTGQRPVDICDQQACDDKWKDAENRWGHIQEETELLLAVANVNAVVDDWHENQNVEEIESYHKERNIVLPILDIVFN